MEKRILRRLAIALSILLLAMLGSWMFGAYYVGMSVAKWDLAWGRYEVATYGYPQSPGSGAVQLDGGVVHLRLVAGCVVSAPTQRYVQGYNAVSLPAIAQQFGPEALQRVGVADTPEDEEPES